MSVLACPAGPSGKTHTFPRVEHPDMDCQALCNRLDEKLDTATYAAVDPSANGLQVGSGERVGAYATGAVLVVIGLGFLYMGLRY